ncbi:MAG: Mobilization protein [Bifidobacterium crudilactis]|jgi:hypothetical protein|uniref:hypothetical protein n=1 Tax=Bifidobacterium crudilactis TaxID=327277 RepID=UPI003A5C4546
MPKAKKPGNVVKTGANVVNIIATLAQLVPPEMTQSAFTWLQQQHFSDKFIDLVKKVHLPEGSDPLERIGYQCDAVEEIIETQSAELSEDAPIGQWRGELDKIRRGLDLIDKDPQKDRKKIKALRHRADSLFNSAFSAAVK